METNEDKAKQAEAGCDASVPGCGVDCCPTSSGGGGKSWKTAVFVVVILLAGAVAAHSLLTKSGETANAPDEAASSFGMVSLSDEAGLAIESPPTSEPPSEAAAVLCGVTLDSIKSLGKLADERGANVAFIFLAGEDGEPARVASAQVGATLNLLSDNGKKVAAFTLEKGAEGYDQLIKQFSVESLPSVIITGKGCGAVAVSSEITEAKLLRAFVMASTPASCKPGGCCPPSPK
ncbi:MAG: hypothetical protein ACYS6W_09970 [Planctomycetota bacterium]|jgi:hypothetical protein